MFAPKAARPKTVPAGRSARRPPKPLANPLSNAASPVLGERPGRETGEIPRFAPERAEPAPPARAPVAPPTALPIAPPALAAIQAKTVLGRSDDPLEHEADHIADQVMRMPAPDSAPTVHAPPQLMRKRAAHDETPTAATTTAAAEAPAIVEQTIRSPGRPLDAAARAFFEPRFARDFSAVRIHEGGVADTAARAVSARAFTLGRDIVFGGGHYAPHTARGRHLLAHELAHVVQQEAAPARGVLRRDSTPPALALKANDEIAVAVYGLASNPEPDRTYSRRYRIDAQGAILIDDGTNKVSIALAGLAAAAAARKIADSLVDAELFRGPHVCVTGPGQGAPVCADAKTAMSPAVARAYGNFMAYIKTTHEPAEAVARYYQWVHDHADSPEFLTITPPELWAQSLRQPERPKDPEAERTQEWLRFMKARLAENAKLPAEEQARAVEALRRFQDWYEQHRNDKDFAKADPAKVYAEISVGLLKRDVEASARKKIEADKEAAAQSPEVLKAKSAKFDEFLAKAMKLWGYSSRRFPYSIPLDSEGKDILVTGDPALQRVLDALANDLVQWASIHMQDANYATVSVNQVLLNLLQGGYSERIGEAQQKPLEHETIDRNELLPKSVLASFGETVATGLFAVAVVGLFVGAEVITGGQATWLLVGMAGYSGLQSYRARRDEIERGNYDVPVPLTLLHSAGDIIGVSQLLEGITGQRLGTEQSLGSEARSSQTGTGGGSLLTLFLGSRAYRAGQRVGQTARLSMPGTVPAGPNAHVPLPPAPPRPVAPQVNPAIGAVENAARAALPENLRPGLDIWSAEIRQNGGNPETVFRRIPAERIRAQAQTFLDRYQAAVTAADRAAYQAAHATDDPLRPQLRNNQPVPDSRVTLHFENEPPGAHEIAQATELSRRTGEEIHLFGDTTSGIQYPGIDGTIGQPPRALSLKRAVAQAHPNLARQMASDALVSAQRAGYSHVEVRIDMPGSRVADIQAAWDGPPPRATDPIPGPAFQGDTIARIIVRGSDGEWTLSPPLAGPARTGVTPVPPRPDVPDKRKKP
ncbi:hypothetical protein PUN4_340053 [Paraburkholderia unamae]|uniref:eCIS core domain-containing protein n=1 Tax=Paraburkholderia unamae TaxID=219649 RepID=UPI001CB08CBB|nr:DUF4157 domain-containing protein [Paraburkholderia unamae]CAG9259673.1 hypothetical protein PUN4_340053 [Paraburkholderia unamae]